MFNITFFVLSPTGCGYCMVLYRGDNPERRGDNSAAADREQSPH